MKTNTNHLNRAAISLSACLLLFQSAVRADGNDGEHFAFRHGDNYQVTKQPNRRGNDTDYLQYAATILAANDHGNAIISFNPTATREERDTGMRWLTTRRSQQGKVAFEGTGSS